MSSPFNQNIIITGCTSGIGEGLTRYFISKGANVIGIARNKNKLIDLKKELGDNFHFIEKDLSVDIENHSAIIENVFNDFGKIDGLILNAGVQETKPLATIKHKDSIDLFNLNYFANVFLLKGLKKKFVAGNGTSVVAISSITSQLAISGLINYSASKAALESMVRTLSVELSRYNIRINAISLGHVKTGILKDKNLGSQYLDKLNKIYENGILEIDDVNGLIDFLISSSSMKINGAIIKLDSGVSNKFGI